MKNLLLIFTMFLSLVAEAQIFYNGDFEINDGCNTALGQVSWVDGWFIVVESADFYSCGYTTTFFPTDGEAACGDAYMGFASYGNATGSAEAIGSQLPNPLVVGEAYDFTIQLKMPTGGSYSDVCGGLCVYGFVSVPPMNVVASHPSLMAGATELFCTETVDNTEWEPYAVTFTADQAYEYLVFSPGYFPNCAQNIFMDCIEIVESEAFDEAVTICAGEEVSLDPGFGADAQWFVVEDDNSLTVITTTDVYTFTPDDSIVVMAEDSNQDTYTYDITVTPLPTPDLGADVTVCEGEIAVLDVGPGFDEIFWNGAAGAEQFAVEETGTVTIEVEVVLNSCSGTDQVDVIFEALPDFSSMVVSQPSCVGQCDGEVSVTLDPDWTYTFDGNPSNGVDSGLCEGSFDLVLNSTNCQATESVNLVGLPVPVIEIPMVYTICEGASVELEASSLENDLTYEWDTSDEGATLEVMPNQGDQFCVVATDANGCVSAPVCTSIEVYDPLTITASNDETTCPDVPVNLFASAEGGNGDYQWEWEINNTIIDTDDAYSFLGDETTIITVTVYNECTPQGVSEEIVVTVPVIPQPELSFQYDDHCLPAAAAFTLTETESFSTIAWNFGDQASGSGSAPSHTYLTPGCFDVEIALISDEGCSLNLFYEDLLCAYEIPVAGFDIAEGTVVSNEVERLTLLNSSEGATSYVWTLDGSVVSQEESPVIEGWELPGLYSLCVEAFNDAGCSALFCRDIEVELPPMVYIPNAFTPDQDGINEVFIPVLSFIPVEYNLEIFDRWGRRVFASENYEAAWLGNVENGTYFAESGVYAYRLIVKNPKDLLAKEYEGHVLLLR